MMTCSQHLPDWKKIDLKAANLGRNILKHRVPIWEQSPPSLTHPFHTQGSNTACHRTPKNSTQHSH